MNKARDNHYVPVWYQKGFFEPGRNTYSYLDLNPPQYKQSNGRSVSGKSIFTSHASQAFCERDLYSTFFGTAVNDEIERKLFGDIDTRGAHAIRAFLSEDTSEWHRQFKTFFEYLDIQKVRTPKGLEWLSVQYPRLTQNELMIEMQSIAMMHCTIWAEGVREIVSAQEADVKFIVSDHPVTVYNHALPPSARLGEPSITLKGSQTIFPLNRDFCLILTNLEYAKDPTTHPLVKRTFAGSYRNSMVCTDAFIRTRKLTSKEVIQINCVIKAQAKRYVAAGREEWLYPDTVSAEPWSDLRTVFLPPEKGLWHFGGEIYVGYESGRSYYQDAFGRTEKERDFLKKPVPLKPLTTRDLCGCGSGRVYSACCEQKPFVLRPTWVERSIRERNLMLFNGITNILGLTEGRDWVTVRREITDDKIKQVYGLYDALWPRETNLLAMLPKPDGSARAIYTGVIHPSVISNCALGLSLYFDELLIADPFVYPRSFKEEFNPILSPSSYRQEFLKSVLLFVSIMPLVAEGIVILFPDPCNFDLHMRDQMFAMAQFRLKKFKADPREEVGLTELMREDIKRGVLLQPRDALRRLVTSKSPEMDDMAVNTVLDGFDWLREQDPLAVLQEGSLDGGRSGGQLLPLKMVPNFEITMYLAQATGSCIVTDSRFRWGELLLAAQCGIHDAPPLAQLRASMSDAKFVLPYDVREIGMLATNGAFRAYPDVMRKAFKYLSTLSARGTKPNVEAALNAEFKRGHASTVSAARKSGVHSSKARVSCLWPADGIQHNTVTRLLLMSNSEHHLSSAPMALFFEKLPH